ncbi:histidine kinase [Flavobacterium noncentrifugens]|uniref:histidine kinase n=1 Tax=Flavobacterium noncentrifugens TaxID=1128970 RepID=A0A1G8V0A3_9FLAO|nr:ATP-binding protein [Flavobacterium noncentrifugens]GEP50280.1 histidine kinase [Flavobacterium noncentrifugens]SDJ59284.1 Bacteriophytochrome (light-regulated signal transduction histidine kinase) [Flavobacterium noncentrifugens]
MKYKDIVNRNLVNLTNCENEPIHIPGSIQPHGFLIGIDEESRKITFCSGNSAGYCGLSYDFLLGKTFGEAFGDENRTIVTDYVQNFGLDSSVPQKLFINNKNFLCSIHKSGPTFIIEAEPENPETNLQENLYKQSVKFVSYMNTTSTLKELCELVAKGTREITGYDRVMIYRFDKEYNGEVFAESCREDIEPFLGLHYPHSDIPPQARELYMRNLLRLITDINYTPVPIYTIADASDKDLDLSISVLRSTSPIHVEYLQNMGVGATLTISLIHRGRLWGLIACHHYSQKNLSPEIRLAAQLQGQFITSQIDVRQSNEEYEVARKTNISLEKLTAFNLPPVIESFKIISISPELLRVCNAAGVSLLINGNVYKNGLAPSDDDIRYLANWCSEYSNDSTFFTDKLVNFISDKKSLCEQISGINYHSLGNGNAIIWYRPETLTEVNWGGDPEKAIIRDSRGLHPRNSFNLWKQVVKFRSNDWQQPELNAAANYAHALQKQIGLYLISLEEERYRKLSEQLKESNAELENINWISTHDLQEPLRKIQFFASMLLTSETEILPEKAFESVKRMSSSANRMQTLLIDILKYTRIKYNAESFEDIDLNQILDEVLTDMKDTIGESKAFVKSEKLPVVNGVSFLLKQLFMNLIQNSLKYADENRAPVIQILLASERKKNIHAQNQFCHEITFSDNGIGFSEQYSESIFNIFTRLHGHAEYKGSGVGLALCKKIMQNHGGTIIAEGRPDEGAVFTLFFPCKDEEPATV